MIIRRLFGIERWGDDSGPAIGAGELPARELDLPVRSIGDGFSPDDTDVLDIAGIRLVAEVEERVAAVL
jgi:hypothetical protein